VNHAIERVERMLRRLIGGDIVIECRLDPRAGHVRVDPGQFEQVVLNLAVNARDAMPGGGTLTLATGSAEVSELPGPPPAEPAPHGYVRLTIGDTGTGMSADVQTHIFEPFFTTKPAGRGTGLGLATVFGIVNQSGGSIGVHSAPGSGTTFHIYFPRSGGSQGADGAAAPAGRGSETILLVEDDADVRRVAARALARHGYRVVEAADAAAAIAVAGSEPVALLLTDVVMPGMSGSALAAAIRAAAPAVKVLFMTGYVQDALERQGLSDGREALLHKPFSMGDLARRVRDVLDGRR
jgi:CheY-like chemotaxis protein